MIDVFSIIDDEIKVGEIALKNTDQMSKSPLKTIRPQSQMLTSSFTMN